ncbi:MAG: hypothetical protein R3F40_10385 [Candidatus Competibacteraceae bacterium]
MLIERVDSAAEVGLAAYEALTKEDADKKRATNIWRRSIRRPLKSNGWPGWCCAGSPTRLPP